MFGFAARVQRPQETRRSAGKKQSSPFKVEWDYPRNESTTSGILQATSDRTEGAAKATGHRRTANWPLYDSLSEHKKAGCAADGLSAITAAEATIRVQRFGGQSIYRALRNGTQNPIASNGS